MANPGTTPQQRLTRLVAAEKSDLWVAVIYSIAIGLFTLALPVATQTLVNTIALGNLLQPLILLSALVFGARIVSAILQGLRIWVVETIQRRIFVRIASDTVQRLSGPPLPRSNPTTVPSCSTDSSTLSPFRRAVRHCWWTALEW